MTFSPGGDVSIVLSDQLLRARRSGKQHMEPIWAPPAGRPACP
jgi:hypothetical protein